MRRPNLRPQMAIGEILSFAYDTFCSNKVRFALTALGMVIGTASLILVVTIGLTGKQYVQRLIQAIGANMIYVEYSGVRSALPPVLQTRLPSTICVPCRSRFPVSLMRLPSWP